MIINIDKDICTGCRECAEICPAYAINGEQGKPQEIDYDKCVMCGQCVQKCKSYLSLIEQGPEAYNKKRAERNLPETVKEPLFAAYNNCNLNKVKAALADKNVFTVVQCAPAVRVGIAEDFGNQLGSLAAKKLAASLRRLGFDRVYDTNFTADLTIMEEGTELIQRITQNKGKLPMFTSCCPAWVSFLERNYPELKDHLSSCKSPQQMGAVFKTYGAKIDNVEPSKMYVVSVMPCTCKEFECNREEMKDSGFKDVDVAITTRELAYLLKEMNIDFNSLPDEDYDQPMGIYTGAGTIFGATGGVMEAAIRTGYELITGKPVPEIDITAVRGGEGFRTATLKVGDLELKVGIVSGLKNVVPVLDALQEGNLDLHFIEVMTCPVGCVSGGGQPKLLLDSDKPAAYQSRTKATYDHDKELPLRKSHENPAITKIYEDYLGKPNGEISHHILHTKYCTGANNHQK